MTLCELLVSFWIVWKLSPLLIAVIEEGDRVREEYYR